MRTWGDSPAAPIVCLTLGQLHQHVAQGSANMQPSFSCTNKGYNWIHRNADKNVFKNLLYTKQNTKIYVIFTDLFQVKHITLVIS